MSGRVRVLHVVPDLQRGGGQVVVLSLAAHRDTDRFDVDVAHLRGPGTIADDLRRAGAEPIALANGGAGVGAASVELARHVRHRGVDVLHVHSDEDRKVGQLAALLTGRPVVGHLHSPWAHLAPMVPSGATPWRARRAEVTAAGRRRLERRTVQHYVAAGPEVAAFHVGHVDAPIAIVANGVDVDRFRPASPVERAAVRRRLGLPEEAGVVISVGRLAIGKGQDELVLVLDQLPSDVHLVLVGSGDEGGKVAQLASWLGVADRVHLLGERTDVEVVLRAADLFAMASVSEGLPVAVLEAMATGVPVVAYDLPGLRQVVTDGVDGAFVAQGDRTGMAEIVRGLLDHQRARRAIASAARARVQATFDAQGTARGVEEVYDVVLGHDPLKVRRKGGRRLAPAC